MDGCGYYMHPDGGDIMFEEKVENSWREVAKYM